MTRTGEEVLSTEAGRQALERKIDEVDARRRTLLQEFGAISHQDDLDLHENSLAMELGVTTGTVLPKEISRLKGYRTKAVDGRGRGNFGRTFRVKARYPDEETDVEENIHLVGPIELEAVGSGPDQKGRKRVSYETPIGSALIQPEVVKGTRVGVQLGIASASLLIESIDEYDEDLE